MPEKFAIQAATEIEILLKVADDRILAIIQRHYDAASRCSRCDGQGSYTHPAGVPNYKCNLCHGTGKVVPE